MEPAKAYVLNSSLESSTTGKLRMREIGYEAEERGGRSKGVRDRTGKIYASKMLTPHRMLTPYIQGAYK